MEWKDFDEKVLVPFEALGDRAIEFGENANVFTYMQVREIAVEAFDAASQPTTKQKEVSYEV